MKDLSSIRRVAVLGAGTMGHGIAQVAAQAGFEVVLRDVTRELAERGVARIADNLAEGVRRGKLTDESRGAVLGRLGAEVDLERAAAGADLVVEAVVEDLAIKRETFATLDRVCAPDALLATNTSSLRIAAIAEATSRPGRVLGMHFFNPVHLMKLCEIVVAAGTAEPAVALARAVAERMGKDPIVVRDVPGFASSRLGIAIGLEAMRMVEEGVASAADIDKAMMLGYGHPMGPLELTDLVGLDVRLAIARYLAGELGERFRPPAVLERLVAEGKLGKKAGQGFYRWEGGKRV